MRKVRNESEIFPRNRKGEKLRSKIEAGQILLEAMEKHGTPSPHSMSLNSFMEVLVAAHISHFVDSPFNERGGIMLVGPPSSLKSTILMSAYKPFPDAMVLGDINVQTLMYLRDDIACHKTNTMAFTEFEKLYQRHVSTASNIEGHIKAIVAEGFTHNSNEDQRMATLTARALVVGAIVPGCYRKHYTDWMGSGFLRRFLWCIFRMKNPSVLMDAIDEWKKIQIEEGLSYPINLGNIIPFDVTREESTKIRQWIRFQPGQEIPFVLLKKILSVLKWHHRRDGKNAMKILEEFSRCLGPTGTTLDLK
jgi:hypothetical protein